MPTYKFTVEIDVPPSDEPVYQYHKRDIAQRIHHAVMFGLKNKNVRVKSFRTPLVNNQTRRAVKS